MVSALDDTPDGNTYNLLAALNTRLGDSIRAAAAWESVDPDDQARAAITATLMLDQRVYEGTPTSASPTQTRAFPRDNLTDKYGTALPAGTTPEDMKQAHALLTYELAVDPELESRMSTAATAVKRVKAGSAEVENFAPGAFVAITTFPSRIENLIAPFLAGAAYTGAEDFGTEAESQFDDCDRSDLTEGLG
jgi:hypothetical protein